MHLDLTQIQTSTCTYRIAGIFGRVNVRQIGESKLVGKKILQMDIFSHEDNTLAMSKIWMILLGESLTIRQICQTFLLPNILAIAMLHTQHTHYVA